MESPEEKLRRRQLEACQCGEVGVSAIDKLDDAPANPGAVAGTILAHLSGSDHAFRISPRSHGSLALSKSKPVSSKFGVAGAGEGRSSS